MSALPTLLARAERLAFDPETGKTLFHAGLAIAGFSMVGLLSVALFGGVGFHVGLLYVAALLLTPAAFLLILSRSLPARHPISVPLIWLICAFSLMMVLRTPSAADGIEPRWLLVPGMWLVAAIELVLLIALAWFTWHLWAKGAFRGTRGTGQ